MVLVLAHLTKGETYTALAGGFGVGTTTVFATSVKESTSSPRSHPLEEALDAASPPQVLDPSNGVSSPARSARSACRCSGYDRGFYSGKLEAARAERAGHRRPGGRLVWASPALPRARHDLDAATEHGLIDGLTATGGPESWPTPPTRARSDDQVPQRRRLRIDPTQALRRLSRTEGGQRRTPARRSR